MDSDIFSLDFYDSIGFDLDNTLAEYNVKALMKLVYNLLANYLIQKKSYECDFLLSSFEKEEYFLQKGLFMDLKKGNILKIGENGEILKATHGTKCLSDEEILEQYGPDKTSSILKECTKNFLLAINTPTEKLFRGTLDFFDEACILLFARIVDHLDEKNGGVLAEYKFWPDILDGLYHLYKRSNFATGESEFFSELKKNPSLYYKKWTPEKLAWFKELKSKKFVFMLTGSFIEFASFTAGYCIGENWKDYFDVILCYARKPFFFTTDHPFLNVDNGIETKTVKENDLQVKAVYSQGNWKELKSFISKHLNVKEPKCLYIGDNLIQDVFSPVHFNCCHSVAVSLELKDEFKSSQLWGSYFGINNAVSYWNYLIRNYAMICVSSLDVFVSRPFNFQYSCLRNGKINELDQLNGYYAD